MHAAHAALQGKVVDMQAENLDRLHEVHRRKLAERQALDENGTGPHLNRYPLPGENWTETATGTVFRIESVHRDGTARVHATSIEARRIVNAPLHVFIRKFWRSHAE